MPYFQLKRAEGKNVIFYFLLGRGREAAMPLFFHRGVAKGSTRLIFCRGRSEEAKTSFFSGEGQRGQQVRFFNGEGRYFFGGKVHRNKASYALEAKRVYADYTIPLLFVSILLLLL